MKLIEHVLLVGLGASDMPRLTVPQRRRADSRPRMCHTISSHTSTGTLKVGVSALLNPPCTHKAVWVWPFLFRSERCVMNIGTRVPSLARIEDLLGYET